MSRDPQDHGDRMDPLLVLGASLIAVAFVVWVVSAQSRPGRLYYEAPSPRRAAEAAASQESRDAKWPPAPPPLSSPARN
jgi:hypothetical protein